MSFTRHGRYMYEILVDAQGIPEKNVVFMEDFSSASFSPAHKYNGRNVGLFSLLFDDGYAHAHLRSDIRVVSAPYDLRSFGTLHDQVSWIDDSNILFVFSAGNSDRFGGSRDYLYSDNPRWDDSTRVDFDLYRKILATDHLIIDSSLGFQWDDDRENISFSPGSVNVKCGETKENCFSVIGYRPQYEIDHELFYVHEGFSTSEAAATLGAISFYLAQFYPHSRRDCVSTFALALLMLVLLVLMRNMVLVWSISFVLKCWRRRWQLLLVRLRFLRNLTH